MTIRGFTTPAWLAASALMLALPLAGCNSSQSASTVSAAPVATAPTTATATASAAPAVRVATGKPRPPGGTFYAAEDICVKAVQQQTNAEDVAVLGSAAGQPETVVIIGFPAAPAPWRCVVAVDGRVTEVKPQRG